MFVSFQLLVSFFGKWTGDLQTLSTLQAGATRFLTFLFILSTFSCTVGVMSLGISVLSPSAGVASLVQCMLQLVFLLFSGFLVNSASVPDAVAWIKYVSVYFYAFNAGITNEMQGMLFTFDVSGGERELLCSRIATLCNRVRLFLNPFFWRNTALFL